MIIVWGGYIACEFAHFFSAMGTKITILQRGNRLLTNQEPEISSLLQHLMEKRMTITTNIEVNSVEQKQKEISVKGITRSGEGKHYSAEKS